ncbi:MAG: lasso peptide biosynthesis B2 protein [Candidatus Competibacter sp.]|nr:lasso peptide biosynthesis B2 protein [Candidatus Competibacter sp.]
MALPGREKLLYCGVAFWLLSVKAGLCLVPFSWINRGLVRFARVSARPARRGDPQIVTRAIERLSRCCPSLQINCLPQALVGYLLLCRRGFDVRLKIGVCKDARNRLAAHAWLEYQDRVLLGDLKGLKQFIPLPDRGFLG